MAGRPRLSERRLAPALPDKSAMTAEPVTEPVAEMVMKPAEPTSKEGKGRKTKVGSVRVVSLIFQISGIVKIPGGETQTVGRSEEIAWRATRIDLGRCRRCGAGNATDEQKRGERYFSAIH